MINKVKENIKKLIGEKHQFRYNGARNQIEIFEGIIIEVYQAIFIIKIDFPKKELKSFTYSDILINNLEIIK